MIGWSHENGERENETKKEKITLKKCQPFLDIFFIS